MDLSVVATLYRAAPHVREFYGRAKAAAALLSPRHEIVLVHDGSPDESLSLAKELVAADPAVRVVDLSRNFGHHRAMMAGLAHARGELVFLIDSDLEEDPELLSTFATELRRTGADVVYGVQGTRRGRAFQKALGTVFYRLFNWLSDPPLPPNVCTVRLMTRRYVRSLLRHRERELLIAGLWVLTGYEQVAVPITKHERGGSTYDLARKLALFVNGLTSFSDKPLLVTFYLGLGIVVLSTLAAFGLVFRRLFLGTVLAGWSSVMVSIWFLGGLTLFSIGVVGIYLSRIFRETKKRPYVIVRKVYEREGRDHEA